MERNLDFDREIARRGTGCIKYDCAAERGMPEDVLPLWVADMDFETSSYVLDAMRERLDHGIFGYTEEIAGYFESVRDWMQRHHDFTVEKSWLVKTPGVVFALAMAIQAYTEPGDAVLIQQPVYYPFEGVIRDNGRKMVTNTLQLGEDGGYHIDFEDFERKLVEHQVKLFLLCSPHNPVSRVWTKEELLRLGDLCLKHRVIVVSDEIHADFAFQGKHHVFAALKKEYAECSVICTSPSKTFNLAGLTLSNIFIPNGELRRRFRKCVDAAGVSELNVMGQVACKAAYTQGEEWYQAMMRYVAENIAFIRTYVEENLPGVRMAPHEGTYLVWLDFRELGLSEAALEHKIAHEAKLWLDGGGMFGAGGAGFQRVNAACPRKLLREALERIRAVI
ncbi:MAG: pyridoxal phosphate-dependent aminotransferase [Bacteroidales bacterium]|nr:pyridoxal phosphate-dependent aminotransferase [Bacteroidales bacterium]MCM1415271.1 pyridoxal phosphate-dependent aminotransferase [bacterium]MCM1423295.1 pyridoxal phosphate-dependent aminotransferase [bacterium]